MADSINPFAATTWELKKARKENTAKFVTLAMCLLMVIPMLLIIADIFIKAGPVLSWEYLTENPTRSGREGGIWLPLVGFLFVCLS